MSFLVATIALGVSLGHDGTLHASELLASALVVLPACEEARGVGSPSVQRREIVRQAVRVRHQMPIAYYNNCQDHETHLQHQHRLHDGRGHLPRRFEKEAFIYIANPTKRLGYAKEHTEAYGRLLADLDEALMSRNRAFTDEERKTIAEWKQAAVFYDGQFSDLVRRAESLDGQSLGAADAGRMTVEYNAQIAEGKNRFRVLLQGAGDLRQVKEQSSQKGADVISRTLGMLGWLTIGLSTSGCLLFPLLAARKHLAGRRPADESNKAPARALPLRNVAIRVA